MYRPGQARHRIRIEVRTTSQDTAGEQFTSWSTFATVWAELQKSPGREILASAQEQGRVPTLFRIRYLAGVSPGMRVVHDTKVYDIISAPDPDGRKAEMLLTTEERVDETAGPDGGPYVPPVVRLAARNVTVAAITNLSATDVQSALEEIQGDLDGLSGGPVNAIDVVFDNSVTGPIISPNVQWAIEDLKNLRDGTESEIAALEAQLVPATETTNGFLSFIAQTIGGLKTFVAGIALQAKLNITGVNSGDPAIEIPTGSKMVMGGGPNEYLYGTGTHPAAPGKFQAGDDIEVTAAGQGVILASPNGTRWRVAVSNAGAITVTAV